MIGGYAQTDLHHPLSPLKGEMPKGQRGLRKEQTLLTDFVLHLSTKIGHINQNIRPEK